MRAAICCFVVLAACGGDPFSAGHEQPAVSSPDASGDDAELPPDARAPEASADGAAPPPDAAGHDDAGTPDVAEASVDAGADALVDAEPDVVDAAPDVDPANPCDAGTCPLGDGSHCNNGVFFGCAEEPMYQAICTPYDWQTAPYICTSPTAGGNTNPPGCGHPPNQPGLWCCTAFCPAPAP